MATTRALDYGAKINGDSYTAQYSESEDLAKMVFTGGTHTQGGTTGPLFRLNADGDGAYEGEASTRISGTAYTVVYIDTSDGIVVEQEPI